MTVPLASASATPELVAHLAAVEKKLKRSRKSHYARRMWLKAQKERLAREGVRDA